MTRTNKPDLPSGTLPWTRSCFVCGEANPNGLRLRSRLEEGRVVLDYTTREPDLGYSHIVHGGIVMTLLDEVMTWAAILVKRRVCVAAEMTTRLKKPVGLGESIRVEGRTAAEKSRLVLTEGRVFDGKGTLLAEATGKYVPTPPLQEELCSKDFVRSPDAIDLGRLFECREPRQG
jgi:uncharacterized protein (TIGR00369 family)